MRTILGKAMRDESGKILIMVLVLLVVGGLVLTPLLGLMSTGLMAGQVYEKKASELYAADAGVEDAIWQIRPRRVDGNQGYTTGDKVPSATGSGQWYWLGEEINDKTVAAKIDMLSGTLGAAIYRVTAEATADGSDTEILAHVQTYPLMWGNAITSTGKVQLQPNVTIHGDVMGVLPPEKDKDKDKAKGHYTINGTVLDPYPEADWPKPEDFAELLEDVNQPLVECGNQLVVSQVELPSGYHAGNLEMINDNGIVKAKLTGTVYIKDKEDVAATFRMFLPQLDGGNADWELDLNGQTIYVEGGYNLENNEWALVIGDRGTIKGPGVIIAEGNIQFRPNIVAGDGDSDFIFVMSIYGQVQFLPNGTFYGSVAGRQVNLQPDGAGQDPEVSIRYTGLPFDADTGEMLVNFPFDKVRWAAKILTWEIK